MLYSIIEAEALGLKEAIQGAISMHLEGVIFESDSQLEVHAINVNSSSSSELSMIIYSIENFLALPHNFKVKFVKRKANSVAHSLVRTANF